MNQLIELDQALFQTINGVWTHPWLDSAMPVITDLHRQIFVQAVVLPHLLGIWIFKKKGAALKAIALTAIAVAATDLASYRILKPLVDRDRPSAAGLAPVLRTEVHTGRSFPSNHSANNFAAATVLAAVFPAAKAAFFVAAGIIAYSRVYVGVHFPLDVAGGAALGALFGFLVILIGRRIGWLASAQK